MGKGIDGRKNALEGTYNDQVRRNVKDWVGIELMFLELDWVIKMSLLMKL